MRKIISMLCLIVLSIHPLYSQIKVVDADINNEDISLKYDSTDITTINAKKYIGQRAIYFKNKDVSGLYTKDYKAFDGKRDYIAPLFTYYNIIGFNKPQEFELKRVDNGDICYYNHFGDGIKPIILVSYFEYHKNRIKNTEWAVSDLDNTWIVEDILIKGNRGINYMLRQQNDTTQIVLKTLWGSKSMDKYYTIQSLYNGKEWVVDSDNIYGKFERIEVKAGVPYCVFKSLNGELFDFDIDKSENTSNKNCLLIGILPVFTKEDALKYINKFGMIRWKQILCSGVKLGMTKEMVLLSVGNPSNIIKNTDSFSENETWKYLTMDVLFINGKVNSITEY